MKKQNTYDTQTFTQSATNNNTSAEWLRSNFWNLLISFIGIIIAWSTMNNKISFLEARAQTNYDKIEKLEELIKQLPDRETLRLELAPIKDDLLEVKTDVKKYIQSR